MIRARGKRREERFSTITTTPHFYGARTARETVENKLCLSMEVSSLSTSPDMPTAPSLWRNVCTKLQPFYAGLTSLLNFLFSFVVLASATLVAIWLAMWLGVYQPGGDGSVPWLFLAIFALTAIVCGCYLFHDLLEKSWARLLLISGPLALGMAIYYHWLLAGLPLLLLLGAHLGILVGKHWQNSRWQSAFETNRQLNLLGRAVGYVVTLASKVAPLLSIFLIVQATSGMSKIEFEKQPVPDVVFETAEGTPWRLADHHQGKVVVIDFWATWCIPCRAAMPEMRALYQQYAERDDFLLLGVSEEANRQTVANFCAEHDIAWQQLYVPAKPPAEGVHPDKLLRPGIPSVWIVDRNGIVVAADIRGKAVRETLERVMDGE